MIYFSLLAFALGTADVDMTLTPSLQVVPETCIAEVDVVLSAAGPASVSAVDVVLSWDPSKLQLLQAIPSAEDWFTTGFLNDPDNINVDLLDGDALYTALAAPLNPINVPPDVLVVTFEFLVMDGSSVTMLPSLGIFGESRVVGTSPGEIVTGTLSGPVTITNGGLTASEVVRLGVPPNPDVFRSGLTSGPIIGATWDPYIDHSAFLPDAILDLAFITLQPGNARLIPFGTLLCSPPKLTDSFSTPPGVPFAIRVPDNCAFVGLTICTQAVSLVPVGDAKLTNALDITIGTL